MLTTLAEILIHSRENDNHTLQIFKFTGKANEADAAQEICLFKVSLQAESTQCQKYIVNK